MRRNDGFPEEMVPMMFRQGVSDGENFQPYAPPYSVHPRIVKELLASGELSQDLLEPGQEDLLAAGTVRALSERYFNGRERYENMPPRLYQMWNMLDWRRSLATPEIAQRWIKGLGEEVAETIEAWEALVHEPESPKYKDDFVSELGDVLFYATASATVLGADIERGTAHRLLEVYGQAERYPTMRQIDLQVRQGLVRRDELYPDGHYPFVDYNLFNHEDTWDNDFDPRIILPRLCGPLMIALAPQAEADIIIEAGSPYHDMAEQMIGTLWIYAAFYSRYYANVPLSETVKKNMAKISGRVEQGSLDDKSKRTDKTL